MPFDPCREWLGIDATDLKDPHRVLAIPPTLTDGDEIARVAEERLAKLSQIVPGPFAKAHAALMTRVAEARDTLLATATWATAQELPEAEPTYNLPPPPPPPPPSPPASSVWPSQPEPVEEDESTPEDVASPVHDAAPVWASPPSRTAQRSSGGAGLGLFAIFLAVAIAGGYLAYKRLDMRPDDLGVAIRTVLDPHVEPAPPPQGDPMPLPEEQEQVPDIQSSVEEPATPVQEPAAHPADVVESPASMPQPAPAPPQDPSPPPPDPEDERRTAAARAQAAAFVNAALQDAFQALQKEEFDAADRAIEEASREVGDDVDSATRVERWRLAAAYARAYAGYRDKAFRSAASGREYEIDGKRIVVIEVTPAKFVYRISGRNKEVSRKEMSPVLEVGIVENWFGGDGRAANYLFLGAKWLCKSPPNHTRARAAWQKAADGGEDAAPLMALLDDPITQGPDGP